MSCPNCISGSLSNGKYICTTEDYRVVDSSDDLVWIIVTHDIPNNDDEINDYENITYCICKHWEK